MEAIPETIRTKIYGPLAHLRTKKSIGADPFALMSTKKAWAGFASIDYYRHLSNSSYAKELDSLRMKVGPSERRKRRGRGRDQRLTFSRSLRTDLHGALLRPLRDGRLGRSR